jgi:hypothetical protein
MSGANMGGNYSWFGCGLVLETSVGKFHSSGDQEYASPVVAGTAWTGWAALLASSDCCLCLSNTKGGMDKI